MSAEDSRTKLTQLKAIRDSGTLSTSVDGVAITFRSVSELQQAIIRLETELGYREPKVRSRSVYMGHR